MLFLVYSGSYRGELALFGVVSPLSYLELTRLSFPSTYLAALISEFSKCSVLALLSEVVLMRAMYTATDYTNSALRLFPPHLRFACVLALLLFAALAR